VTVYSPCHIELLLCLYFFFIDLFVTAPKASFGMFWELNLWLIDKHVSFEPASLSSGTYRFEDFVIAIVWSDTSLRHKRDGDSTQQLFQYIYPLLAQ
jgi:hypothetical protein